MRHLVLSLAAFATVGLSTGTCLAWNGYQGSRGYSYRGPTTRAYSSHLEAVRRITAHHSRYRYRTHPRSLYNALPPRYPYYGGPYRQGRYGGGFHFEYHGWGYGYR